MNRVQVCVRGGGVVGHSLALALARQGVSVGLVEAPAGAGRPADVRTYALGAGSVRLLRGLRVWQALPAAAVTPVQRMLIDGDSAGHLEFSAWRACVDALAWIVDAGALEDTLAAALRFAPHVLRSASPLPADLQAVCEGRDSATRAELGVVFERQDYAQTALAARLVADRPHQGVARQWFRGGDVLALLPFEQPQSGASYGLVWSLPTAQAERWLHSDPAEFEQALQQATGSAPGRLQLASARVGWPLALGRAQRWSGPGWVLVGDAAHGVHPLAGQGLNLGLADVVTLVDVLAQWRTQAPEGSWGDERMLRRYARARLRPTLEMGWMTDGLLQLFARPEPVWRELRNRGLTLVDRAPGLKRWLVSRAVGG